MGLEILVRKTAQYYRVSRSDRHHGMACYFKNPELVGRYVNVIKKKEPQATIRYDGFKNIDEILAVTYKGAEHYKKVKGLIDEDT